MIDVLYLIGSLPRGGAARHLLQLVRALDRSRVRPQVLCLRREGDLIGEFEAAGVPVAGIDLPLLRHPFFLPRLARLVVELRRQSPSVLHTYLFPSNFFGSLAGRLAGVPVVITSRRSMNDIEPRRHLVAYRLINRLADRVVAVSGPAAEAAARTERLDPERLVVIENGLDARAYEGGHDPALKVALFGVPPSVPLIGMVSTYRPLKGQDDLIEMARIMAEEGTTARFVIVGEGPGRPEAQSRVAELGLTGRFLFAGHRDDIPQVLRSLDLFVYPSRSEGMSNALMEAMAAGCPVIAAACPGNDRLLQDGAGILVPPADPVALAREATRLLADPDAALRLGRAARERIRGEFGAERMAARYERLYADCLRERGLPAGEGEEARERAGTAAR